MRNASAGLFITLSSMAYSGVKENPKSTLPITTSVTGEAKGVDDTAFSGNNECKLCTFL